MAHWDAALIRYSNADPHAVHCGEEHALFKYLEPEAYVQKFHSSTHTGHFRNLDHLPSACASTYIWYGNEATYFGLPLAHNVKNIALGPERTWEGGKTAFFYYYCSRFLQGLAIFALLWRMALIAQKNRFFGSIPGVLSTFTIALAPMLLQQSFAVTADTIVLAACLALTNVYLNFPKWNWFDLAIAIVLGFLASSTKPVFVPAYVSGFGLFSLACLFERRAYLNKYLLKSREILLFASVLLIAAYVALSYIMKMKGNNPVPPNVDPHKQLAFLLQNPWDGFLIVNSAVSNFLKASTIWGGVFGWFDFNLSSQTETLWKKLFRCFLTVDIVILTVQIGLFVKRQRHRLLKAILPRVIALGAGFVSVYAVGFLSALSMYMYWTKVGHSEVDGVQQRYFLPCSFLTLGLVILFVKSLWMHTDSDTSTNSVLSIRQERIVDFTVAIFVAIYRLIYAISMNMDFLIRYY